MGRFEENKDIPKAQINCSPIGPKFSLARLNCYVFTAIDNDIVR
jgi:hypothetical protein